MTYSLLKPDVAGPWFLFIKRWDLFVLGVLIKVAFHMLTRDQLSVLEAAK